MFALCRQEKSSERRLKTRCGLSVWTGSLVPTASSLGTTRSLRCPTTVFPRKSKLVSKRLLIFVLFWRGGGGGRSEKKNLTEKSSKVAVHKNIQLWWPRGPIWISQWWYLCIILPEEHDPFCHLIFFFKGSCSHNVSSYPPKSGCLLFVLMWLRIWWDIKIEELTHSVLIFRLFKKPQTCHCTLHIHLVCPPFGSSKRLTTCGWLIDFTDSPVMHVDSDWLILLTHLLCLWTVLLFQVTITCVYCWRKMRSQRKPAPSRNRRSPLCVLSKGREGNCLRVFKLESLTDSNCRWTVSDVRCSSPRYWMNQQEIRTHFCCLF